MKIKFKPLSYQLDAVNAVVDTFCGQEMGVARYTLDKGTIKNPIYQQSNLDLGETHKKDESELDFDVGFANAPLFDVNEILKNIQKTQIRQGLEKSDALITTDNKAGKNLTQSPLNLTVEMETGTGKTYTYIRTIFELNRRYGWSKFIIVVPSIAIREGVNKSLQMMADDLMAEYGKKPRFFIYNSKALHHLESFSSDAGINIMIINTQAFNTIKEGANNEVARKIYTKLDDFGSRRPIDVIARNRPILILDEPQKMAADKTLESLSRFKPLFILRYSATHKREYNLIYRLDALDAYNQKLVKKITVKGIEMKGLSGTSGYLYLQEVLISKKAPVARLELEIKSKKGTFRREIRQVEKGDDLYVISGESEQYKDRYTVSNITHDSIEFTNGITLHTGQGNIDDTDLRRIQIRETIKAHLQTEQKLFSKGIKVLSLFFIDEVAKYRQYDTDGKAVNGEYAKMFIEAYQAEVANYLDLNLENDAYQNYLKSIDVNDTHNGYFSLDKNRHLINPTTKNIKDEELGKNVAVADDVDAYDLILKDKESLLAFAEPHDDELAKKRKSVRFIFSHSALREGWDNPNVFVICTLKQSDNVISRRQEVGRGLRLAVDKYGNRMDSAYLAIGEVHRLNHLTVITNESYADFVGGLQQEIKDSLKSRPSRANPQYFEGKVLISDTGGQMIVNEKTANQIYKYLVKHDYVDDDDGLSTRFQEHNEAGSLPALPEDLRPFADSIVKLISSVVNPKLLEGMVNNGNKQTIKLNQANLDKKEFQALWRRINQKAIYQIELDSKKLIDESIKAVEKASRDRNHHFVPSLTYTIKSAEQTDTLSYDQLGANEGFEKAQSHTEQYHINTQTELRYDLVGQVAERTNLTRRTVVEILTGISNMVFSAFKQNPEAFISEISRIINDEQAKLIVQNISYELTKERYHTTEIFVTNTNTPISERTIAAERHVYDHVETDSNIEQQFVQALEEAVGDVVVYAKLPKSFSIPTPFGGYNPDWAIAFNQNKKDRQIRHIYFVAETKGSTSEGDLRDGEKHKIESARAFFEKLSQSQTQDDGLLDDDQKAGVTSIPVSYQVVDSFERLMQVVGMDT